MKKRKKGAPDTDSPEEMRRKLLIGLGVIVAAIFVAVFAFRVVVPRVVRMVTGETTYAGYATSYWSQSLAGNNPEKNADHAMAELRHGGAKAVPVLIQILENDEATPRARAALILSQIASKDAVPALIESQKDSDQHVRCWSAYALAMSDPAGGAASIPALLEATLIPGADLTDSVEKALGQFPAPARVAGYAEALTNPSIPVRFLAVRHLGAMGEQAKDAAPQLILLLRDRFTDHEGFAMGDRAMAALSQVNPEARNQAAQQYLKDLQSPNADRAAAAYALGRLRDAAKPALPTLLQLVNDQDPLVASAAYDAVQAIDPSALNKKK